MWLGELIRRRWATATIVVAGVTAGAFIVYLSNRIVEDVRHEGKAFANVIKETSSLVDNIDNTSRLIEISGRILEQNDFVPVILTDDDGSVIDHRNIPLTSDDAATVEREVAAALEQLRESGDSVKIEELGQTLYYGDSRTVRSATYVRWMEIAVIVLFGGLIYVVLTSARRRERDNLWRGLACETAHQLGTPIQALAGWRDLLAEGAMEGEEVAKGMSEDIERLSGVSERFSKIGSTPQMTDGPLNAEIAKVVGYIDRRTGKHVKVSMMEPDGEVSAPHSPALLQWAVENICKNAADAIGNIGCITVTLRQDERTAIIEIADTGKGMSRATQAHIFDAGFSTKTRGWGLGLALVKRIVTEYHSGRVFVVESRIGVGTTFRIELKKKK